MVLFTMMLGQRAVLCILRLWEGNHVCLYLLSDHIGVVAGLDFEGAIVGPQVNGIGDACYASFIYLCMSAFFLGWLHCGTAYQLRGLGSRDGKLKICILFPISKQQGELRKETIVYVSGSRDRLGTGVAVETSLKGLCGADEFFPVFKAIWFFELCDDLAEFQKTCKGPVGKKYHFCVQLLQFCVLFIATSKAVVGHGC